MVAIGLLASGMAGAEEIALTPGETALFWVNNIWMLMAAFLVFIMHLGFAALETGLTQSKNTVNILFKNVCILCIGILTYAVVGFNLMYPGEAFAGGVIGFAGFGVGADAAGQSVAYADGAYTYWTDFIFQAMFAATAATIVSGAVAERVKLPSFLVFSAIYVAIAYPIVGMWQWGGGFLSVAGFHDFAGSTIVHSVGGWAALAGALVLGPRLGRFSANREERPKAHSMPLAVIGMFLLWFGWYGFNGGSVLSADAAAVSYVVVTTSLAAASGALTAAMVSWGTDKLPDLSMVVNGALAGLVGITAGADLISPLYAVAVGVIAGILVYAATKGMESLKIDDPVGAIPVHLVCGIWGTLAVGFFSPEVAISAQLFGIAATGAFCFPVSFGLFKALDLTMGMRVSEAEEIHGLDIGEHGMEAYAGFGPAIALVPGK